MQTHSETTEPATIFIYGLIDPQTQELRYVGKTGNLRRRLQSHINHARANDSTYRQKWIRSLMAQELRPIIAIIEECAEEEWEHSECFWISYFLFLGCRLTNGTLGGEGMKNPTAETRAKLSRAAKARDLAHLRTPEAKAKGIENRRGLKRSPETLRRLSEAHKGYRFTDEQKVACAERMMGEGNPFFGRKHSEETKAKIRAAKALNPTKKLNTAWPSSQYEKVCRTIIVTTPEGAEVSVTNIRQFCLTNDINSRALYAVIRGERPRVKGWKARRVPPPAPCVQDDAASL